MNDRVFEPKTEDPLDNVIEIINMPEPEHKKSMYPYVEATVQTAGEIDKPQQLTDNDIIDLQTKFDKVNNVATTKETKENRRH